MSEVDLLKTIRTFWVSRATQALAKGAGVKEDLKAQLERFYELLIQAVDTGDPAWLDSILNAWSTSLTMTDLDTGQSSTSPFLSEIMRITWQVCHETLDPEQALSLTASLLPAFTYSFERIAYLESQERVKYVSTQLNQVKTSLERLDRSKSDFISVAAHELRTPLTLIEGYTAMLRDARDAATISEIEVELMNGINSGARRLKAIIDDMIDVSLIDNSLLQLNFQPIWVNRLLKALEKELSPALQERNQKFCISDFPGSAEMTYGDPERLLQVLRNVLTNAIKYTPDSGIVNVDGRKLPGFIEIIIRDTGIGIAPEDQELIFEKFTRLGSTSLHSSGKTKFKGGGPGLGLHIARGILEAHGGAIWAESPGYDEKKNPGSTFHILLPIVDKPPDDRLARLLKPLINNQITEEIIT